MIKVTFCVLVLFDILNKNGSLWLLYPVPPIWIKDYRVCESNWITWWIKLNYVVNQIELRGESNW